MTPPYGIKKRSCCGVRSAGEGMAEKAFKIFLPELGDIHTIQMGHGFPPYFPGCHASQPKSFFIIPPPREKCNETLPNLPSLWYTILNQHNEVKPMGSCIIFCAAEFDRLAREIGPEDHVIAADGGLRHTGKLGIVPHEVLGDFDSLGYTPDGAQVFPVEKDDTDAMLAVRRGLELGYREFILYGSLDGPRLDHTVANFQTLQYLADRGAAGYLVGSHSIVTVIKDGALTFPRGGEGTVSVFCLGPDAEGVDIRGLYYPLENGRLIPGFPLGVSNHFLGERAQISVKKGSLLVIWDRDNGFPQRWPK